MEYNSQLIFQSKFGNIKIISKEERISNIDFTTENIKNSNSKILNATKNQIEELHTERGYRYKCINRCIERYIPIFTNEYLY